jgi:peptidyl-prolyl cis-trans isomerase SurA
MKRMIPQRCSCLGGALVLAAALAPLGPAELRGQAPEDLADGIVAIVGDTAILLSELREFVFEMQAGGIQIPQDPEGQRLFLQDAMDQKLSEVVVYVHALKQGITIPESRVEEVVEDRLATIRRNFASELEFQQALAERGATLAEFRIQLTGRARTQLVTQSFIGQTLASMPPVPVSEEEIRQRWELQKRTLGPKPAAVTLEQVVIQTQPTEEAVLVAEGTARQILSRAQAGEDFAVLAREFSQDPGSASQGGSIGWVRHDGLLPEFADALFAMQVGELVGPVETVVGLHIIRLDRVRGNERLAAHVLIIPEVTDADRGRSRAIADEVAEALRSGADIDSLNRLYGDESELTSLTEFPIDRLPESYKNAIPGHVAGDIVGPFEFAAAGPVEAMWIVAEIRTMSQGGEWRLDDYREQIRQQLQQEKMLQRVVGDLREATYIENRLADYIDLFIAGTSAAQ